jgi:GH35 family endo-1,4-beta-xylanase
MQAPCRGEVSGNPLLFSGKAVYSRREIHQPAAIAMKTAIQTHPRRFRLAAALAAPLLSSLLCAAPLTPDEILRYETDLGVTLTDSEKTDIARIAKPDAPDWPAWRVEANARIEQHRKADLTVRVRDRDGLPVPGARVRINLKRNAFAFGGVLDLYNWNGKGEAYRTLVKKMFNAAGAQNGLKPKIANKHGLLPGFFQWARDSGLPVRGHLLIWPGSGSLPYRQPYELQQALDALRNALAQTDPPASDEEIARLRTELIGATDFQIGDWASKWGVYEWDVINEPLEKRDIQNALDDYGQMARWFQIADANKVLADCGLGINEYQIISAKWWVGPGNGWSFESRTARYRTEIDRVLADGGRIDRIGFQSRFKYGHIDPALVNQRLAFWENAYPDTDLVGTEFEIKDATGIDEFVRAQMTEELLTSYYSHPHVTGLNVWTFMRNESKAMCNTDGTLKLNGLVWYYLHRIRYATRQSLVSGTDGNAALRGFKGDYALEVSYGTAQNTAETSLAENSAVSATLDISIPLVLRDEWFGEHPGTSGATGWLEDPDGDGSPNLAEYAFGSRPDDAGSRPAAALRLEQAPDGAMQCVFRRRRDALSRGLRYVVEHTSDLSDPDSWTEAGVAETSVSTIDEAFEEVRATPPFGDAPRGFARIRVEFAAPASGGS